MSKEITTTEAAAILNVDAQTVARWCKDGIVQAEKNKRGRWLVSKNSTVALREKRKPKKCDVCGKQRERGTFALCTSCQIERNNRDRRVKREEIPDGYIDTGEAAAIVNRSGFTISNWCTKNKYELGQIKIHGKWFVQDAAVRALVGVIPSSAKEALRENGRRSANSRRGVNSTPPKTRTMQDKKMERAIKTHEPAHTETMARINKIRQRAGLEDWAV